MLAPSGLIYFRSIFILLYPTLNSSKYCSMLDITGLR
ncbi:hypothetical protein MTR67_010264 [Solanum verrucosum]|uniref:Uncharacterized protein n=1 Tax=Solanum verrucosum TaxID=315347 RepID=A0AAF0QBI4_SOLVR|nr:hypothetical protein MTR67_010264 [Solanum verrucosum]